MDSVSKNKRSEIMSHIRSNGSRLEHLVRAGLWSNGIRYRLNSSKYFGKPDICLSGKRTVIFIDSCFWHGCNKHLRLPSSNSDYWSNKITKNMNRDIEVNKYYKNKKWNIIRIWEHDLKNKTSVEKIVHKIAFLLRVN